MLLAAMVVAGALNLQGVFEPPYLVLILNLIFSVLASAFVIMITGMSFIESGTPELLLLCCGVAVWGTAGLLAGILLEMNANIGITVHNSLVCVAAACHLTGSLLARRRVPKLRTPGKWLAIGAALAVAATGLIILASFRGWLPVFFVQNRGGSPIRYAVLIAAAAMFLTTSILLMSRNRRVPSPFLFWYSLALGLLAAGIAGITFETVHGGLLSWSGRTGQFLAGAYMIVAAIANFQETHSWHVTIEQALRDSEKKYETLLELLPDAVIVHQDLKIAYANPAALRLYGAETFEQLRGRSIMEYLHPESRAAVRGAIDKVIAGGSSLRQDRIILRLDGRTTPVEATAISISLDGRPAVLAVIRDVTERRQAVQALRESEERYRNLYENMDEGYCLLEFIYDSQGEPVDARYIDTNPAYEKITGLRREDILNKTVLKIFPGMTGDKWLEDYRDVVRTGEPRRFERFNPTLKILIDVFAFRPAPGRFAAIIKDITEIKNHQEALKKSHDELEMRVAERTAELFELNRKLIDQEVRFREMFENMSSGVAILEPVDGDEDFIFRGLNRAAEKIAKVVKQELLGRRFTEMYPVSAESGFLDAMRRVLNTGRPEFLHPGNYKGRPGIYYENRIFRLPSGEIVVIFDDIREKIEAEEERQSLQAQLLQSQKMEAVGMLAGGVAHDFNNLLSPIIGYAELGLRKMHKEDPFYASMKRILDAGIRAKDLTKQLLAFGRKQTFDMSVINLNVAIKDFGIMLRRLIKESIDIAYYFEDDLRAISADVTQIQQIIINLAVNANDAMPDGGKLQFKTANAELDANYCAEHPDALPGQYVMLAVSDTGIGMDAETVQHIFEPFFTTKKTGEGTGLGLATVYGIVKQHGGCINVYSESGKGTTFKVYLPIVDKECSPMEVKEFSKDIRGQETVLVVEDEENVRELAKSILEEQGYKVLHAGTPNDAMLFAQGHDEPIDLLLTDVVMPQMNGKELYQRIVALHPEIKVLYMSGYTHNIIAHHNILEEGIHFIQKPFTVTALTEKLREVLGV